MCTYVNQLTPVRRPICSSVFGLASFFFFKITFFWTCIYFFIYILLAALSLCCCTRAFSSCSEWWLLQFGCPCFSLWWLLLLQSCGTGTHSLWLMGPRACRLQSRGLSCSTICGIFLEQRWNPCLLHWQVDSYPLRHQGSPWINQFIAEKFVKEKNFLNLVFLRFNIIMAYILISLLNFVLCHGRFKEHLTFFFFFGQCSALNKSIF